MKAPSSHTLSGTSARKSYYVIPTQIQRQLKSQYRVSGESPPSARCSDSSTQIKHMFTFCQNTVFEFRGRGLLTIAIRVPATLAVFHAKTKRWNFSSPRHWVNWATPVALGKTLFKENKTRFAFYQNQPETNPEYREASVNRPCSISYPLHQSRCVPYRFGTPGRNRTASLPSSPPPPQTQANCCRFCLWLKNSRHYSNLGGHSGAW